MDLSNYLIYLLKLLYYIYMVEDRRKSTEKS